MAPTRPPSRHSRAARSAKDPRGIYAPPSEPSPTTLTSTASPADLHTGPSTSLKRKREAPLPETENDDWADFKVTKKDKRAIRHQQLLSKVKEGGIKKQKRRRPGKKLKTDLAELGDALPETKPVDGEEDVEWMSEEGEFQEFHGGILKKARKKEMSDAFMNAVGMEKTKEGVRRQRPSAVMTMTSLTHRPGAMKRRRAMEEQQRERFAQNYSRLMASMDRPVSDRFGGFDGGGAEAETNHGEVAEGDEADRLSDVIGTMPEARTVVHAPQQPPETTSATTADRWAAMRAFIGQTMEQNEGFTKK